MLARKSCYLLAETSKIWVSVQKTWCTFNGLIWRFGGSKRKLLFAGCNAIKRGRKSIQTNCVKKIMTIVMYVIVNNMINMPAGLKLLPLHSPSSTNEISSQHQWNSMWKLHVRYKWYWRHQFKLPPICHQEGIWLTNHNTAMYVFNGIGPIRMIECGIMNWEEQHLNADQEDVGAATVAGMEACK